MIRRPQSTGCTHAWRCNPGTRSTCNMAATPTWSCWVGSQYCHWLVSIRTESTLCIVQPSVPTQCVLWRQRQRMLSHQRRALWLPAGRQPARHGAVPATGAGARSWRGGRHCRAAGAGGPARLRRAHLGTVAGSSQQCDRSRMLLTNTRIPPDGLWYPHPIHVASCRLHCMGQARMSSCAHGRKI